MRIKISSIIGLCCLVGCVYQIYDITKFYLQFKVRRDVAYNYSTHIELPAIDIMVPMTMALNFSALLSAYPKEMLTICENLHSNNAKSNNTRIETFSIDFYKTCHVHLNESPVMLSNALSEFIKVKDVKTFSIDLLAHVKNYFSYSYGYPESVCNTTRYYNGVSIFIRLLCLNGTELFSIKSDSVSLETGIVSFFTYSFALYFGVRFSDPVDSPVYDHSKYFIVNRKRNSLAFSWISFQKTVMSSLEYPYETSCRYYNKDKSISKCVNDYTLGQTTPYLFKTLINEWNEHPDNLGFHPQIRDDQLQDGNITRNTQYESKSACSKQATATECEKTSYSVEGKTSNQAAGDKGMIFIMHNGKANIYLRVHPVLPWSEYIIFIGSIVGIWFGISVYDIILKMFTCIVARLVKIKTQITIVRQKQKLRGNQNLTPCKSDLECIRKF